MKKEIAIAFAVVCFLAATLAPKASAQDAKPVNAAGTWNISITHGATNPGAVGTKTTEQWTIEQKGKDLTGKTKVDSADGSLTGDVEGLDGDVIHLTEKVNDDELAIQATVVGDSFSGTIRSSKNKNEGLLTGKRSK